MHGWDNVTAYLAASPGAMSQVIVLATEIDADMRAIAIVQTMRVVIIAVGLPVGLSLFGLAIPRRAAASVALLSRRNSANL